jgi:hypothetical protein
MSDQWEIRGRQFANCNCAFGCPCQFSALTTHGFCQAVVSNIIEEGRFNDVSLDGLGFLIVLQWPGEIAEGNGRQQVIVDERANDQQREAIRKIALGEAAQPGSNIFYVYNSTMSEVLDTLYAPLDISIDVAGRKARVKCQDTIDSSGSPMINPFSGEESRAGIHLPGGLEYTYAEMGVGNSSSKGEIAFELNDSYGQFADLHWNQDGVIHQDLVVS